MFIKALPNNSQKLERSPRLRQQVKGKEVTAMRRKKLLMHASTSMNQKGYITWKRVDIAASEKET